MFINENNLKKLPQVDVIPPSSELDSAASMRGDIFIMQYSLEDFNYKSGEEKWYNVPSLNGIIQISNYERIRSWKLGRRKEHPKEAKQISTYIGNTGYIVCTVRDENQICRTLKPHRLFALIFLENPQNLPEVNHINGNKLDNNPKTNLEWCDKLHNMRHAFKSGLMNPCTGVNKPQSKLTEAQVLEIFYSKETGRKIAPKYGINFSQVYNIRKGLTWNTVTGMPKKYKSIIQ